MSYKNKIKKIKRRSGELVIFDKKRIINAILKAGQSVKEFNHKESNMLSNQVIEMLNKVYASRKTPPSVEEIQDIVEVVLMKQDFSKVAKAYIIYRKEHQKIRQAKKEILFGERTKLDISLNALKVMANRYLLKDVNTDKVLEIPEQMFQRVAKAIALVEKKYKKSQAEIKKLTKEFYDVMFNLEFLPAGRTLANAGGPTPLVSNCIVLHIQDSMKDIFTTLRDAALLQQAGSGIGFPLHLLRPSGSVAKRTMGVASGPTSFLFVYDEAFNIIKQQGRHGANMAVMRVDHPDILDFINIKEKEGTLKNFNISVALTNEFMRQVDVKSKNPWVCRFNNKKYLPRKIIKNEQGAIIEIKEVEITASDIMKEIVEAGWLNGEPGVIFIDEVNKKNPLPGLGRIEACNPCGEQFLHDGDVCNLGSINLSRFVKNKKIDWQKLKHVVHTAVRMLDNVIDITEFSTKRVSALFKKNRRIGLGIMGFADFLFQLDIPYNSANGRKMAEKTMKFIRDESHTMSQKLAKEKGVFENYNLSIYKKKGVKMRNAALTTIAPTGSISMVCDASSGLEPNFALSFVKKSILGGQSLYYTNKHLEQRLQQECLFNEELVQKIAQKGSLKDIKEIPDYIKKVFVGAMDISVVDHVKMQSSFQKYTDNSISKTINFPNKSSQKDVLKAYLMAWKTKCKSCTVYRQGSRDLEVLSLANKKDQRTKSAILDLMDKQEDYCPHCNSKLVSQEGCMSCVQCGFGLCSG